MKKVIESLKRDLWVVLLDILAVNLSYYLALLIRFFDNTTSGIFKAVKPQYMVV